MVLGGGAVSFGRGTPVGLFPGRRVAAARSRKWCGVIQGYLAHQKTLALWTLQTDHVSGPRAVLAGWAFFYGRGTRVGKSLDCSGKGLAGVEGYCQGSKVQSLGSQVLYIY